MADHDKYFVAFEEREAATQKRLADLKELFRGAGVPTDRVEQSISTEAELGRKYREALQGLPPDQPDWAHVVDKRVRGIDRPATDAIDAIVEQVTKFDADVTKADEAEFHRVTREIELLSLASMAAGVAIAVVFGWWLSRSISRQLRTVADNLGVSSTEVAAASEQISIAGQTLASSASEQAAAVEETSASLEEITSVTNRTGENAQKAKSLAAEIDTRRSCPPSRKEKTRASKPAVPCSRADVSGKREASR